MDDIFVNYILFAFVNVIIFHFWHNSAPEIIECKNPVKVNLCQATIWGIICPAMVDCCPPCILLRWPTVIITCYLTRVYWEGNIFASSSSEIEAPKCPASIGFPV
ncbi:MAG: hypothetical protein K0R14_1543 [Burkholderiales bacterium]|nr:hypothetical protein [Burkholderiales bacterium]